MSGNCDSWYILLPSCEKVKGSISFLSHDYIDGVSPFSWNGTTVDGSTVVMDGTAYKRTPHGLCTIKIDHVDGETEMFSHLYDEKHKARMTGKVQLIKYNPGDQSNTPIYYDQEYVKNKLIHSQQTERPCVGGKSVQMINTIIQTGHTEVELDTDGTNAHINIISKSFSQ